MRAKEKLGDIVEDIPFIGDDLVDLFQQRTDPTVLNLAFEVIKNQYDAVFGVTQEVPNFSLALISIVLAVSRTRWPVWNALEGNTNLNYQRVLSCFHLLYGYINMISNSLLNRRKM